MKPVARIAQPFTAADRILTLTVAAGTFVLRWLTLDFDNDYFMHMAWAADMLRGQWPVRDFVEPGFPLQTGLAYAGLRLGGYQLSWEGAIACAFIALSTALTYAICRRLGVPRWLSLLVVAHRRSDVSTPVHLPESVRVSGGDLGAPVLPASSGSTFARPRRLHDGRRLSLPPRSWGLDRRADGCRLRFLPLAGAEGCSRRGSSPMASRASRWSRPGSRGSARPGMPLNI